MVILVLIDASASCEAQLQVLRKRKAYRWSLRKRRTSVRVES